MRHAVLRLACAVLLLVVLPRAAAAQNGRISGVVNDENGHAIKAATVTAEFPDAGVTMTATTDEKGRFSMIGLRSGRWNFIAQAPGYAPRSGTLQIRAATPNPPLGFDLVKRGDTTGPLASVTNKELQSELSAADTLFEQQKWDEAVAAYRAIAAKMPGVAVVIDPQIAAAYLNKKDYNAATAIYNDMLKADPANERAALGISSIAAERGDAQAAVDALMRVAGASNTSRDVFYRLADLKLGAGDVESATMWYEKAAAADPFWGKPVYKLGVVALNKGDQSSASTLMNRVITIDPESAEAGLARSALEQIKR